jgi:hypothetical protein
VSCTLLHPLPTLIDGAAVNVGADKVFTVPVAVYVGSSVIWVPENDGEREGGGKT